MNRPWCGQLQAWLLLQIHWLDGTEDFRMGSVHEGFEFLRGQRSRRIRSIFGVLDTDIDGRLSNRLRRPPA